MKGNGWEDADFLGKKQFLSSEEPILYKVVVPDQRLV